MTSQKPFSITNTPKEIMILGGTSQTAWSMMCVADSMEGVILFFLDKIVKRWLNSSTNESLFLVDGTYTTQAGMHITGITLPP